MVDFKTTWENIIENSPFSIDVAYKKDDDEIDIKAIKSRDESDYSISEITLETKGFDIDIDGVFKIDDIDFNIVSFKNTDVGTLKIWIEEIK